jgi:hypothetical protein
VNKPLALPLEIVPRANLLSSKASQTLLVHALFQTKPLADANLGWTHPSDGESPRGTIRNDAKGEALIPIMKTGLTTIRLIHMTRPMTADYEWDSFWTTLTFRLYS